MSLWPLVSLVFAAGAAVIAALSLLTGQSIEGTIVRVLVWTVGIAIGTAIGLITRRRK